MMSTNSSVGIRVRESKESSNRTQIAQCCATHNSGALLAVAGGDSASSNADLLRIVKVSTADDADFVDVATTPLPDSVTALAWRNDLLLAASYNGVVLAFTVPQSAFNSTARSTSAAATRRKTTNADSDVLRAPPARVHHPQLHDMPVPPPTPGVFMRSSRIACVDIHPTTPQRFLTLENTNLHVWDLNTGVNSSTTTGAGTPVLPQPLAYSPAPALCAQWSPHCADAVLCGGRMRTLSLLDLRQRRAEAWRASPAHDGSVLCCRFSPLIPHWVASGGTDGFVRIWDLRTLAQPVVELGAHEGSVESLDWSPCYAHLLTSGGRDRMQQLWSLHPAEPIPPATKLWHIVNAPAPDSVNFSSKSTRLWSETTVLSNAPLFADEKYHEPLVHVAFLGGDLALHGTCVGVASSGEIHAIDLEEDRLMETHTYRFDEDSDGREVERLLWQRKLDTAFTRAFALGRRTSREADLAARRGAAAEALTLRQTALAALQLCYQCAAPETDPLRFRRQEKTSANDLQSSNGSSSATAQSTSSSSTGGGGGGVLQVDFVTRQLIQQARRRLMDELNQYTYFLPPNVPRYSPVADATTLNRVAMLRLMLEVRILAALGNADELLEREADVLDALERDVTAIPRTALSAMVTCVLKFQSLSTAIAMCQRLEAPMTKDKRPYKAYAALVHTVLRPTVYDETKESLQMASAAAAAATAAAAAATAASHNEPILASAAAMEAEVESDDASESTAEADPDDAAAVKRAADRKKKRHLDKFVRELLTESKAQAQLKFAKRFAKRVETNDPQALAYGRNFKPRVVLPATVNDQFMDLALHGRRFDVLYSHALELMAVVDGYPYHAHLVSFLLESFEELDRFIELSLQTANDDRCLLLCDVLAQLACIVETSTAMPQALFEKCMSGLTRGTATLTQSYPDRANVERALERMRLDGVGGLTQPDADAAAPVGEDSRVIGTPPRRKRKDKRVVAENVDAVKALQGFL